MIEKTMTKEESPPELDDALIDKAKAGEAESLAAVYDAYAIRLYRYFYSWVANSAEAEDLTAQTFIAVIEALPRYHHRGQFTSWIFQIGRNKVMDYFRRNHRQVQVVLNKHEASLEEPLDVIIQDQTVEMLRLHIQQCNEDDRELLRLRFVANCTYPQIAALLGRKEDAVRKSLNRLLNRLYLSLESTHA